jgi:hypothetical protein
MQIGHQAITNPIATKWTNHSARFGIFSSQFGVCADQLHYKIEPGIERIDSTRFQLLG